MKKSKFKFKKAIITSAIVMASFVPLANANDVKLSGFLSIGGGVVEDKTKFAYNDISEEDFTLSNNLLGLQITGTIAENLTATGQFIARNSDNYTVNSEWAYLTYTVSGSSKVRAGRIRAPFYLYSDFLDVGYAYSWIQPPREVYYAAVANNINGVDYFATGVLGSFDTTFETYFGSADDETQEGTNVTKSSVRNQVGVVGTLGKDWWNLRAAYVRVDVTLDNANMNQIAATLRGFNYGNNADKFLAADDKVIFMELGGTIDTGTFVAAAEHIEIKAKDTFIGNNKRDYIMLGVRNGDFLYHITASKDDDEVAHPEAGIPSGVVLPGVGSSDVLIGILKSVASSQSISRNVLTLGVRWDITAGTALKFQFDDVDDDNRGKQKVYAVAVQTVF